MTRGRYRKASPKVVADLLDAFAEGLTISEILAKTGVSTTVLYKAIEDYPLWASFIKRRD